MADIVALSWRRRPVARRGGAFLLALALLADSPDAAPAVLPAGALAGALAGVPAVAPAIVPLVPPGVAVGVALAVAQLEIPANDGWVTDLADLLDEAEEARLEQLMESYRSGSGHEVALLTIPSLEGAVLESFAREVARGWKIGSQELNQGALLLVVRDDRVMRIEVAGGLEGLLPDSVAGRILRQVLQPAFAQGRFGDGLFAGIQAIHAALGGDYGPIERERQRQHGGRLGGLGLIVLLLVFFVLGGGRRRRALGSPVWFWGGWALGRSWGHGGRGLGGGFGGGGLGGGGFRGFGGGGGFSGGGASGRW